MLDRILEPEVMDTAEEALAYDRMDHSAVNSAFVDDLLALADRDGDLDHVLDLGTGTAQIPIELCRRSESTRVMAVDASAEMLRLGMANLELANLTERIHLEMVDAKRLPYDTGRFSAVTSNSIVHHIPEPATVLTEAWRVLAPDGLWLFRDLLRPADEATLDRLVEQYAGDADDHQRRLFADSLRAALSLDEVRRLASDLGAAADDVRPTGDRHWTWVSRRR